MKISNLLAVAGLVAAATSAHAVAIPGLTNVNTGQASGGGVLSAPAQDPDWILTAAVGSPSVTTGGGGWVTTNGSFPMNVWLPNSSTSTWLTPTRTQGDTFDTAVNGVYTWTLTFNLTGFVPTTASFSGQFLADNSATISLNGNLLATTGANAFTNWTPFSASSGFVAGLNFITVVATNAPQTVGPNPTGIRVEFTSTNVSAVPEPSALALSLAGLAMVGALAKRRLSKAA